MTPHMAMKIRDMARLAGSRAATTGGQIRAIMRAGPARVVARYAAEQSAQRTAQRTALRTSESRYRERLDRVVAGEPCPPGADRLRRDRDAEMYRRAAEETIASRWPYWRSASSWAGGEHVVRVEVGEPVGATTRTERAWSRNGKWSGTNSFSTVRIAPDVPRDLLVCGGLITVRAHRVGRGAYRAEWIEQAAHARNSPLRVVSGYIVRGYHVRGGDLESAIVAERQARRQAHAAGLARAAESRRRRQALEKHWLTVDDCRRAGLCGPGTDRAMAAVAARIGARIDDIRAGMAVRASVVAESIADADRRYLDRCLAVADH